MPHLKHNHCTATDSTLTNALNRINTSHSLADKVLTTSQPDYLHNLISVQSTGRTRRTRSSSLSP